MRLPCNNLEKLLLTESECIDIYIIKIWYVVSQILFKKEIVYFTKG